MGPVHDRRHREPDAYYDPAAVATREKSRSLCKPYGAKIFDYLAHYEELFVTGPTYKELREAFDAYDFYHVGMFITVPGNRALLRRRQMENVYYRETRRKPNMIFTRVAGSAWDIFTIGFCEDLRHFAGELTSSHHDTLAYAVE